MTATVTLEIVSSEDMPAFKSRMQRAFTMSVQDEFPDHPEHIPPERDIDESLAAPGAEALQIVCDGEFAGGAIASGSRADKMLDFIFIDPEYQNKHIGLAAWNAIEARYPNATHWELVTPYFEKRNIHFYVNRCGFVITEYFNEHHVDPNHPEDQTGDYPGEDSGMFKFEKTIVRS